MRPDDQGVANQLKLRLLIADDSPEMRRLLRTLLGGIAGEIVECASGADAVRLYFDIHPDWVLMDVRMDGVDGISATRQIVRGDPAAKIIVLTQYDEPEIRDAVADAGAIAYMDKGRLLDIRKLLLGP